MGEMISFLFRSVVSGALAQKARRCYFLAGAVPEPHDRALEREAAELRALAEEVAP